MLKREENFLARESIQVVCRLTIERRREEIYRPKTKEHEKREVYMSCKEYLENNMQLEGADKMC